LVSNDTVINHVYDVTLERNAPSLQFQRLYSTTSCFDVLIVNHTSTGMILVYENGNHPSLPLVYPRHHPSLECSATWTTVDSVNGRPISPWLPLQTGGVRTSFTNYNLSCAVSKCATYVFLRVPSATILYSARSFNPRLRHLFMASSPITLWHFRV